jgi:Family of unknown function (DUF6884)
MYISPLFQKMMAYAEGLNPKGIFILSAKYGLLNPNASSNRMNRRSKR